LVWLPPAIEHNSKSRVKTKKGSAFDYRIKELTEAEMKA
jgi:hypothetical protein